MPDPLITPDDVADFWRPLTSAEEAVADSLIRVASSLVRSRVPDIDQRIAAGTLDQAVVAYVVTEMLKSAVEATGRPVDAKSVSDTAGPFSRSISYAAAQRLAVTDDLLALLGVPVAAVGSARLGLPERYQRCDRPVWR